MYRLTLVSIFAALMMLGLAGPALAEDQCDDPILGLFPGEVSMCQAYCTHMGCSNIQDGDPLSAPQASENACGNVAVSFIALVEFLPRSEIDPSEAMNRLDTEFCTITCVPPDCGGGG